MVKCTRCQENGLTCSFDFVTQKKMAKISEIVLRETKNRNKRPKLVSVANARILPRVSDLPHDANDSGFDRRPSPIAHVADMQRIDKNTPPTNFSRDDMPLSSHRTEFSPIKSIRSDEDYFDTTQDVLWAPTPPTSNPEMHPSHESIPVLGDFSLHQFEPVGDTRYAHALARRVTGITPELELRLLDEYMDLVFYQLPVFDSDQVYMRYKFCFPTPLPTFLLKTLIALGAAYTCRRPFDKAIVNHLQARRLYDDARQCILQDCIHDESTDAIAALMLIVFHWQDELTSKERERIFSLSVSKVQALRLHTYEGLMARTTRREIGQLKMLVWINYVMDAFSILIDLVSFQTKDKWMAVSYLHLDVTIGDVDETDLEFMHIDLLTGKRKESSLSTEVGIFGAILYFEAIIAISRIMNEAQRLKESGLSMQGLIPELAKLESESFSVLDFRSMVVEMMDGMYKGLISLNFTFWYAVLFLNFDAFLPIIRRKSKTPQGMTTTTSTTPSTGPTEVASQMSFQEQVEMREDLQRNVNACVEAAIAMLDIFEKLQRNGLLAQTSQIVREQLYLGGYTIQLFYRERVGGVNDPLLARWESCLEISELVWGFSNRGGDLGRMRLEELD